MGKDPPSVTTTRRPGRIRAAATNTLNRLTEVESVTTTCPGAAPTRVPMTSPTRSGAPHQSASFQDRMSRWPHSVAMTRATASGTAAGSAPRELPSR